MPHAIQTYMKKAADGGWCMVLGAWCGRGGACRRWCHFDSGDFLFCFLRFFHHEISILLRQLTSISAKGNKLARLSRDHLAFDGAEQRVLPGVEREGDREGDRESG